MSSEDIELHIGFLLGDPAAFLKELCRSFLTGLKAYLLEGNINPLERYEFGSFWIRNR